MKQSVRPTLNQVESLINKYNSNYNIRQNESGTISIQFHDNNSMSLIVMSLTDNDYSFEIDQGFEVPPIITIYSQVNPEL